MKKKPHQYFLHYYTNDFHRTTLLIVGDPTAAHAEIKRLWAKKPNLVNSIIQGFAELEETFDYVNLHPARSGREAFNDAHAVAIVWFPAIPEDSILMHELLHVVQDTTRDVHIRDDEYDAHMLTTLFEHFSAKLHEDAKLPFENPKLGKDK